MARHTFVASIMIAFVIAINSQQAFGVPYLSRPDLDPPKFEFSEYNDTYVTEGYIIMAPYSAPLSSNLAAGSVGEGSGLNASEILAFIGTLEENQLQNGPYIFDERGNLIYSGFGSKGAMYTHDVKISDYNGKPHFTYFQGNDLSYGSRGESVIMDESYKTVRTIHSGNGKAANDLHELDITPQRTALMTIFQPTPYDLHKENISQSIGWVTQGIAQEIDLESEEVLFEWQSIQYVDPSESYNADDGSQLRGNGTSPTQAWDYFHMNSISKFANGDYLISSRYCSTLFRINGRTGEIKWRLGGKKNDFTFVGFNNSFAFQHHSRVHAENDTTTVISLFDNGSDGKITVSNYSSAYLMAIDTSTMTCTQMQRYHLPDPVLATSQGSMQILPNGNVFVGWGSEPSISEFTRDGGPVMVGSFGSKELLSMNYRAFKIAKSEWKGTPGDVPAIFSYWNSTMGSGTVHASWNGATEIRRWKFYGGINASQCEDVIGETKWTGFETTATTGRFYAWAMAVAMGEDGLILGRSPISQTYIGRAST